MRLIVLFAVIGIALTHFSLLFGQATPKSPNSDSAAARQDQAEHYLELFEEVKIKLEQSYRNAQKEYDEIKNNWDTITVAGEDGKTVTLHQLRIRKIDEELTKMRKELAQARAAQKWVEAAIETSGEQAEALVWILQQENKIRADNNLSTDETLRRYKMKIDHTVNLLDSDVRQSSELYKFHYEKAVRLEIVRDRLNRKEEEIALIRNWLENANAYAHQLQLTEISKTRSVDDRLDELEKRIQNLEKKQNDRR